MERFIVKPSVKLFVGEEITKDTVLDYKNETTTQHLENLVMITTYTQETEYEGSTSLEESKVTTNFKEGTRVLYSEEEGYIQPRMKMVRVKEAIEELGYIEEVE